jgi:hypothetical protein
MPIHDLICKGCGVIEEDVYVPVERLLGDGRTNAECACCNTPLEIYLGFWPDVGLPNHGRDVNERLDKDNFLRKANVSDDPVCAIEAGLRDKHGDEQLRTFSPEQTRYVQEKILTEGDTYKLRQEVLSMREKNIKGEA